MAFAIAPAFFWSGELLSEEVPGLFRKNWGDRSFLEKTFDPRGWDFYQGRELSYAIDYFDAQWVRWLLSRDVLCLVPPSGLLASLAFVPIGIWLVPRAWPGLDRTSGWLALLVLLSNFVFQSTMGVVYRATKPLVAPLLLALLLLVVAEHRRPRLAPRAAFGAVFGIGLVLGMLDRQGLFYLLLLALVLGLLWMRNGRGLVLLAGAVAAAAAWFAYLHWIGPWIIHSVNDYWPSMRFQRLRPERLLQREPWRQAVDVLADWTSVLLGGVSKLALMTTAVAGAALWAWRERREPRRLARAAILAAVLLAAQVAMVAIMVERHSPVAWIGNRLWYYPLPFQAVLTFGLLFALGALSTKRLPRAVPLVLVAILALNVLAWPERRTTLDSDPPFQEQARHSALFVRSLRNGSADPELDGGYRRFYFECLAVFPALAARTRDQVGEGDGFLRSEHRNGRLTAWALRESHVIAWTRAAGRHRLTGTVRLSPGETLSVLLGTRPPRLLGQIHSSDVASREQRFAVPIDLGAGSTDVQLLSNLEESRLEDRPPGTEAAYQFVLPLLILRESGPAGRGAEGRP